MSQGDWRVTRKLNWRQTYWRTSTGSLLHRCRFCWRKRADESGIVYDNGFIPVDGPYQHEEGCIVDEEGCIVA